VVVVAAVVVVATVSLVSVTPFVVTVAHLLLL